MAELFDHTTQPGGVGRSCPCNDDNPIRVRAQKACVGNHGRWRRVDNARIVFLSRVFQKIVQALRLDQRGRVSW